MVGTSGRIALLIVSIFAIVALVYLFLKAHVNKFVQALLAYRRQKDEVEQESNSANVESAKLP